MAKPTKGSGREAGRFGQVSKILTGNKKGLEGGGECVIILTLSSWKILGRGARVPPAQPEGGIKETYFLPKSVKKG